MALTQGHRTVVSMDGTLIAYEMFGEGAPLITVGGATCDRALMRPTAQALGHHFQVVNYDRRGRGDSGDTLPYAVDREIADLSALINQVGGPVHLYGHSSGAGLVLRAAAAKLDVDRIVLHDPPYSPDSEVARQEAANFAKNLLDLLADGRREEAIEAWFRAVGMGDNLIEVRQSPLWPGLLALAPTLAYDSAVMGDISNGGAVPTEVAATVRRPALILVGGDNPPFMRDVGQRLTELIPDSRLQVIDGQGHVVAPDLLVPLVREFLTTAGSRSGGAL